MLAAKSGKIMDTSFYIGRTDTDQYKATVKTPEGPKEKVCEDWNGAVSWVNEILDEQRTRRGEADRDS